MCTEVQRTGRRAAQNSIGGQNGGGPLAGTDFEAVPVARSATSAESKSVQINVSHATPASDVASAADDVAPLHRPGTESVCVCSWGGVGGGLRLCVYVCVCVCLCACIRVCLPGVECCAPGPVTMAVSSSISAGENGPACSRCLRPALGKGESKPDSDSSLRLLSGPRHTLLSGRSQAIT